MATFRSLLQNLNEAPLPPPPPPGGGSSLGGGGMGPSLGGLSGGGGLPPMTGGMGGLGGGGLGGGGLGGGGLGSSGLGGPPGAEGGDQQGAAPEFKFVNVGDVWKQLKKASEDMEKFKELTIYFGIEKKKEVKKPSLKELRNLKGLDLIG